MEVDAGTKISTRDVPSSRSLAKALGLEWSLVSRQCKIAMENRRTIKPSTATNIWTRFVVCRKGHLGITAKVRLAVCDWIVNHKSVVHSPIAKDTLLVRLPGSLEKQRVGKLLLEIPV
jgi:hypothetical protein